MILGGAHGVLIIIIFIICLLLLYNYIITNNASIALVEGVWGGGGF